jgi:hypothetical protein
VSNLFSLNFAGSLSDYAKSLIPNLLNEEDVQLLRCLTSFFLGFSMDDFGGYCMPEFIVQHLISVLAVIFLESYNHGVNHKLDRAPLRFVNYRNWVAINNTKAFSFLLIAKSLVL